ncbi:gephyrin-like molybdotransferase Glp [Herbiconiux sp. L3-i23]|uniref:molybdopterin molybdotransferase MoeA n=1 Tax=Herbiconiux sp. L3-i23 TaxID=2905871 RepID=UPI00205D4851|nr:gephyrin-like molybdotransferase Glp [Herbiconiux sp. L3-i23]BDI21851.1 putative molybdopterin biosynthesis protein MoeA [Herbiconiux sp. L3-i23]
MTAPEAASPPATPSAEQAVESRRSVDEHARRIEALLADLPVASERVPLERARGRVSAVPVLAPVDLPLFRNSQMDGFAVASADLAHVPATLRIGETIAAAPSSPVRVEQGTAARIMTGAVVPEGADCVVPVEHTHVDDGQVTVLVARSAGDYVREPGTDVRAGARLLTEGVVLAPRHLAALAAAGLTEVAVLKRIRVAVISSGAEIVPPGATPAPGQVFDANTVALASAARESGAEIVFTARTSDDAHVFRAALDEAVRRADLVITSGGVSKGEFEVVRDVLEPLGADVTEVAMQPGGPQSTAVVEGVPVVSFPGNPVSAQVSFAVFLRPVLRRASGLPPILAEQRVFDGDVVSVPGKRQWLRGTRTPGGRVRAVSGPSSHLVATMAAADCLLDIPETLTRLHDGDAVEVLPL